MDRTFEAFTLAVHNLLTFLLCLIPVAVGVSGIILGLERPDAAGEVGAMILRDYGGLLLGFLALLLLRICFSLMSRLIEGSWPFFAALGILCMVVYAAWYWTDLARLAENLAFTTFSLKNSEVFGILKGFLQSLLSG